MPAPDLFYERIAKDNRAYLIYSIQDEEDGALLSIGTQVRVLEVEFDRNYGSGAYALCKVKGKERKICPSLLMPRKDWEKLVSTIGEKAVRLLLNPPQSKKKKKKKKTT